MSEASLPASIIVPALVRQVAAAGGFATILSKGSQWGSAMLLVHRWRGDVRAYERLPRADGQPGWSMAADGEEAVTAFVARQCRFDPDLWVIELDVADAARFVPELSHTD